MEIYAITPTLKLLNLEPPIPGYQRFIGAFLFHGEKSAIIDVGPKAVIPNLLRALTELGLSSAQIDYIVLTHIHIDHAGGAGTAMREMINAELIAHSRAIPHLVDPTMLWRASLNTLGELAISYGEIEPVPEQRITAATDRMKLDLGAGLTLELYLTPGHAPHHLSIFDRANRVLIAGETAGVCIEGYVRPATPPPLKMEEALSSIDRLIDLEPQKLCYGHFGCYDNGVERMKNHREKLLNWQKTIASAVKAGKSPEDILALLRKEDRDLVYLDSLDRDESARELALLSNTIRGLAESI